MNIKKVIWYIILHLKAQDIKVRQAGANEIEITDGEKDWFVPMKGDRLKDGYIVRRFGYDGKSWAVVEKEKMVSGEFLYINTI